MATSSKIFRTSGRQETYKKGTLVPTLFTYSMMDEPPAVTGSIPAAIPKLAIWLPGERRPIRQDWASIRSGHGAGHSIEGSSTTGPLLIWMEIRAIRNGHLLKWDAAGKKWIGDVPDNAVPPMGTEGAYPFIMKPDGVASLFGPGLKDGPFPEHYEPLECPIEKNLMSNQRINPVVKIFEGGPDKFATCDPKYPFVCSTYRVTEHWQTGVLTRWLPWLIEAEPQMFCEMSLELGKLRGIKNGDKVIVETQRGKLEAVAIVTSRLKPFNIAGQTVHQIGIPWHFGWLHPKDGGESANLLTPTIGDPNTMIPESKAFMANVSKLTKQPASQPKRRQRAKGGDINGR